MPYDPAIAASNSSEVAITADGYPYMTAAVYWCLEGRKFDDGSRVRTLNCIGNGYWSYPSVACARTSYCVSVVVDDRSLQLAVKREVELL